MATNPGMTPISKHIAIKYHWFRQYIGKEFVIQKIDSENQKTDIFTKGLQGKIFVNIRKFLCGWQAFRQEGVYREITFSVLFGDVMV